MVMRNGSQIRECLSIWKIVNDCQYSTVAVAISSSLWLCRVPNFVLNDLYMYIIFFILQNVKKFSKKWMTRIICSWHFFISSVKHIPQNNWKHRSTVWSISSVATNISVFKIFEEIVYLALIINSDVISQIFKTLYNIFWW